MTSITVGIHVHAQPEQLRATLDSLRANACLPFSIVLLPDGPDAQTRIALDDLAQIPQFGTETPQGGAACFNRLANHTEVEVIILLESGTRPGPRWLEYLLQALYADCQYGLAGPSTNRSWNEQCVFPASGPNSNEVELTAQEAVLRFGDARRTLEPLYSLADFCYAVRRDVIERVGEADESYGLGPCWEMDYNIRAARYGFQGVWACASYVYRAPFTERRRVEEARRFHVNKRRYQDKFCGARLRGEKQDYREHCFGDACPNFAPAHLIALRPPGPETLDRPVSAIAHLPLVSCIMPTRDRRGFVPKAIASFLRQDYPHLELIVVDDGADMVRDLVPADSRIRYFPLTEKLTIGAKRNYACQQARGTIIVHWDDDDWYAQNRVRAQVDFLLNSKTDITGTSRLYYFDVVSGQAYLFQGDDASHPWVAGNTLAYRRSYWQSNPFPDIQISEDFQFVWAAPPDSVKDTKSLKLVIGCLHQGNVSPKNTAAGFWQPASASLVRAIIEEVATPEALSRELVSCIMPTFNRRPFVPLALQCFRSQTYPHKELIVVDDGSDPVADLLDSVPDVRYLRVSHRLTIGAKRNLACREARGEIIAHLDDDDWYAPDRLEYQIAPLLAGVAELTGLTSRFVLQLPACRFWTVSEDLHRQMFVGNVHGGTLVYWRSILREGLQYPDTNLAEDAALIRDAASRGRQLLRLENPGVFVYLRHGHNAWRFDPGHLVDPAGWSSAHAPPSLPPQLVDAYRVASESMQAYVHEIANAH